MQFSINGDFYARHFWQRSSRLLLLNRMKSISCWTALFNVLGTINSLSEAVDSLAFSLCLFLSVSLALLRIHTSVCICGRACARLVRLCV